MMMRFFVSAVATAMLLVPMVAKAQSLEEVHKGGDAVLSKFSPQDQELLCYTALRTGADVLAGYKGEKDNTFQSLERKINEGYMYFVGRLSARYQGTALADATKRGQELHSGLSREQQSHVTLKCHAIFIDTLNKM